VNRPNAPLPRREATDELVRRYHEASAQDPARPSPALREAVLAQARAAAARSASTAEDAESSPEKTPEWIANNDHLTLGYGQKSSNIPNQATNSGHHAANDASWRLRAVASVAVLGLATLLFLQFERGTPDERELTSGGPALAPPALPSRPGKAESADTASAPAPLPEPAPASVLRNTPTPMGPGAAEPQRARAVQAAPAAPASPGKSAVPATLPGESGNVVAGVSKDAGSIADRAAPSATADAGPTNRALKAAPPATAPIAEPAAAAAPAPATPPTASLGAAAPAPSTAPARTLDASPAESRARLVPMPAAAQERAVTTGSRRSGDKRIARQPAPADRSAVRIAGSRAPGPEGGRGGECNRPCGPDRPHRRPGQQRRHLQGRRFPGRHRSRLGRGDRVNLKGSFLVGQAVAREMAAAGRIQRRASST
jgi:hypothetical protein